MSKLLCCAGRSKQSGQQQQEQQPTSKRLYSLLDVDMSGCHAAVHVAKSLGCLDAFRQHYLDQRRLQMSADLQPPQDFVESHRTYLAQVGYLKSWLVHFVGWRLTYGGLEGSVYQAVPLTGTTCN